MYCLNNTKILNFDIKEISTMKTFKNRAKPGKLTKTRHDYVPRISHKASKTVKNSSKPGKLLKIRQFSKKHFDRTRFQNFDF